MPSIDLWYQDLHKNEIAFKVRVDRHLWSGQSRFQRLDVLETRALGRVLVLDGVLMTSERDEFIYHEAIAHTPLFTHPGPRRILVIGGGDGGTVREALKHPGVERVDLVEIDALVVEKSREYLPSIAAGLDDPRVAIHYADGIAWVREHPDSYDVVVVDSTDPVGPAEGLFTADFYRDCAAALGADGVLSAQTQSPFFDRDEVRQIHRDLAQAFATAHLYSACVPTYPGGYWSFALASKGPSPLDGPGPERFQALDGTLRYYNPALHRASFVLPNYVEELVERRDVGTLGRWDARTLGR